MQGTISFNNRQFLNSYTLKQKYIVYRTQILIFFLYSTSEIVILFYSKLLGQKRSPLSGHIARVASDPRVGIFGFRYFGYETMSNNCWIDWNSAVLCFKRLFSHKDINVCPICAASLSHHTLYGKCNIQKTRYRTRF